MLLCGAPTSAARVDRIRALIQPRDDGIGNLRTAPQKELNTKTKANKQKRSLKCCVKENEASLFSVRG